MRRFLAIFLALVAGAALAQGAAATDGTPTGTTPVDRWQADPTTIFDAAEIDLDDWRWIARPVVVFADTPANPAFAEQLDLLTEQIEALVDRDVVIIVDTDPGNKSDLRSKLRPRGFMLTLIGKDGRVKLRKPFPWDVRELSRSIDKMPMRQQELHERRRSLTPQTP